MIPPTALHPTALHQRPLLLSRRGLLASMAGSAVVLLAACSGSGTGTGTAGTPTTTGTAVPQSTASQSTASQGTTTAPGTGPAKAGLVAGFPSTVLPLMPGAVLEVSSLEKAEPVSTASLTATVTATPAAVLDFYTASFAAQGFTAQPGDAVDGTPLKTFLRADGQEIVTVSVVQSADTATFTLGATLLPASIK